MRKEVETTPPKGIFSKRQCNELPSDLKTDLSLLKLSYTEKRILASYRHTSNARVTGKELGMPDRKAITTFRNLRNKVKEIC